LITTVILIVIELSTTNIISMNKDKEQLTEDEKDCAIIVKGVKKTYSSLFSNPFEAVKGINFNGLENSCFVILGTNGAGKSTLFKCMTGEVEPTSGDVFVGGQSLTDNQAEARKIIGYCPQENSIIDLLTARETLFF